eukprot:scaffold95441_cov15-Tisochrysis_lutea.AAC.1
MHAMPGVVGNSAVGRSVAIPRAPPTPDGQRYSGAFGRVEKQRQRLFEEQKALLSRNPAAYEEDFARQSEDKIRQVGFSCSCNDTMQQHQALIAQLLFVLILLLWLHRIVKEALHCSIHDFTGNLRKRHTCSCNDLGGQTQTLAQSKNS